ncbi:hypothetical protein NQ176_g1983 [Zarea fungicola]|uniref:Uncharacterized protein n=1 Tax=Zarea fungicola TaxID=93591 RepID=A0ACC1NQW1_9HYPO|nr:hypothetical protein NQ176_g1983 [Lecanicillium fungicola]
MTDVAAPFAPELIQAYPEAKVVLVIREYDKWQRSFDAGVLANAFGPVSDFAINFLEAIAGTVTGASSRKVILGYWRARNVHEIRTNMRETYDRHHTQIRKLVPPERLLEYRLGEGWESLCEFLDKPVPNQQFPHVNEAAELQRRIREKITRQVAEAARNLLPWALAIAVAGVAFWKLYRKTDIL